MDDVIINTIPEPSSLCPSPPLVWSASSPGAGDGGNARALRRSVMKKLPSQAPSDQAGLSGLFAFRSRIRSLGCVIKSYA